MDSYHRSGGQLPTWEESAQLAVLLREYGEIDAINIYFWFRNYRVRGRSDTAYSPAEASTSAPTSGGLHLFPLQAGDLAGSRDSWEAVDIVPATDGDDAHLTRLELRTQPEDEE